MGAGDFMPVKWNLKSHMAHKKDNLYNQFKWDCPQLRAKENLVFGFVCKSDGTLRLGPCITERDMRILLAFLHNQIANYQYYENKEEGCPWIKIERIWRSAARRALSTWRYESSETDTSRVRIGRYWSTRKSCSYGYPGRSHDECSTNCHCRGTRTRLSGSVRVAASMRLHRRYSVPVRDAHDRKQTHGN